MERPGEVQKLETTKSVLSSQTYITEIWAKGRGLGSGVVGYALAKMSLTGQLFYWKHLVEQ
jgi:hypothetical protein